MLREHVECDLNGLVRSVALKKTYQSLNDKTQLLLLNIIPILVIWFSKEPKIDFASY